MYNEDLAAVQHHGFADFAAEAGPGILRWFREAGITSGHVLDLGCGDGAWLRQLTERGFAATGIEQSASLAKYARVAAPRATIRVASLHRTPFPRCDAITALGEVLSYLPSERSTAPSLTRIFERAHRALRRDGLLIFDVLVNGPPMDYHIWRADLSWAVLAHVHEDARRRRLTRDIITFRRISGSYRRAHERHMLAVGDRHVVLAALRDAGFAARTFDRYGAFRLPPRRLAFMARKR